MNTEFSESGERLIVKPVGVPNPPSKAEIQAWLIAHLAQLLSLDPATVDVTFPFERYGLDSSAAVVLSGDLQEWLGQELDPTLLFDYPTIESLSDYLG